MVSRVYQLDVKLECNVMLFMLSVFKIKVSTVDLSFLSKPALEIWKIFSFDYS